MDAQKYFDEYVNNDKAQGWLLARKSQKVSVRLDTMTVCDGNAYDAMLLSQILFWHDLGEDDKPRIRHVYNGNLWLLFNAEEWRSQVRFNSVKTVRGCLDRLAQKGIIIKEQHRSTLSRHNGQVISFIRMNWDTFFDLLERASNPGSHNGSETDSPNREVRDLPHEAFQNNRDRASQGNPDRAAQEDSDAELHNIERRSEDSLERTLDHASVRSNGGGTDPHSNSSEVFLPRMEAYQYVTRWPIYTWLQTHHVQKHKGSIQPEDIVELAEPMEDGKTLNDLWNELPRFEEFAEHTYNWMCLEYSYGPLDFLRMLKLLDFEDGYEDWYENLEVTAKQVFEEHIARVGSLELEPLTWGQLKHTKEYIAHQYVMSAVAYVESKMKPVPVPAPELDENGNLIVQPLYDGRVNKGPFATAFAYYNHRDKIMK